MNAKFQHCQCLILFSTATHCHMWLDMLTGSTDSVKFGSGYIYVNQFQFGFRDGLGQFKFGLILDESSSGQFRVKLVRICLGMG